MYMGVLLEQFPLAALYEAQTKQCIALAEGRPRPYLPAAGVYGKAEQRGPGHAELSSSDDRTKSCSQLAERADENMLAEPFQC